MSRFSFSLSPRSYIHPRPPLSILFSVGPVLPRSRLRPLGRVDDTALDVELDRDTCNIITKYSPEYVKNRVLRTPTDAVLCLVGTRPPAPGVRPVMYVMRVDSEIRI
jgi:hypothetical protein